VNPELPEDWMDEALRSRAAMIAPSHFTPTVLRRVAAEAPFSQASMFVMEYGARLGLTLALLGLGLTLDVNRFGLLLQEGLQAPLPVALTAAGLCMTLVWLSITADEPI
jgi:hypothetical protein